MEKLIIDAKKGGIRVTNDSTVENVTNWDLQSTIFLALQIMGSVGELRGRLIRFNGIPEVAPRSIAARHSGGELL